VFSHYGWRKNRKSNSQELMAEAGKVKIKTLGWKPKHNTPTSHKKATKHVITELHI
jgi:hypothetical protein